MNADALVAGVVLAFPDSNVEFESVIQMAYHIVNNPNDCIFWIPQAIRDRLTLMEDAFVDYQDVMPTVNFFSNLGPVGGRLMDATRNFLAAAERVVGDRSEPSLASCKRAVKTFASLVDANMLESLTHYVRNLCILKKHIDPEIPGVLAINGHIDTWIQEMFGVVSDVKGRAQVELLRAAMEAEGFFIAAE